MKIAKLLNNKYAIRLEKGEEIMDSLATFAKKHPEVGFAQFSMIGAVEGTEKDKIKVYLSQHGNKGGHKLQEFTGKMELLPSWGNIAWKHDNPTEPAVHCHVNLGEGESLSASDGATASGLLRGHGGHLGEAKVSLTAEIILEVLSHEKFTRKMDQDVQLELWNFPSHYSQLEDNSAEKELEKLKQKNQELQARLEIFQENYQASQKETKQLKAKIEELNKKITDLQAQVGTGNEEKQKLQTELEKKQTEVKELGSQITSLTARRQELRNKVRELEDKLEEAGDNKEELQTQLVQTKGQLETCQKDLTSTEEKRRGLITQIDKLQATLTNIDNSKNEVDRYRRELTNALIKQKELEGKIKELESSTGSSSSGEIKKLQDELGKWSSKFPNQTPEQINLPALVLDQTALSESKDFLTNYMKLLDANINDNNGVIAKTNNESAKQSYQQDNVGYQANIEAIKQFVVKWYK